MRGPHPGELLVDSLGADYWACLHPERPHDPDQTAYWSECRACVIALQVAARTMPDGSADLRTPDDPDGYAIFTAAEALAQLTT